MDESNFSINPRDDDEATKKKEKKKKRKEKSFYDPAEGEAVQ